MRALSHDGARLPIPRSDRDREALRILLGARSELTTAKTRQINRLRALLLAGQGTDRCLARRALTSDALTDLAHRRARRDETREQVVRRTELRRLACSIRRIGDELADNKTQLSALVQRARPDAAGLRRRRTAVSAAQAIVSWSHPG